MDPQLDVKRASLCIETLLDHFRSRQAAVADRLDEWNRGLSDRKQINALWAENMADCHSVS